jgi:hypothetical protein
LYLFRQPAQKWAQIPPVFTLLFDLPDEKSDCAVQRTELCYHSNYKSQTYRRLLDGSGFDKSLWIFIYDSNGLCSKACGVILPKRYGSFDKAGYENHITHGDY